MLVQEADYSAKVFVQSSIPRSWHEMEYQCRSSGGHLVSFDTQVSLISKGRSVLFNHFIEKFQQKHVFST